MWTDIVLWRVGRALATVLVCMGVVGAMGAGSAAAAQVTVGTPQGVVPHQKGLLGTAISPFSLPSPQSSLLYWGGPVLRTNQSFAIFWDPAGAFPSGYRDLIDRFLRDVAADSGKTSNVYSVLNQYYDTTGSIAYDSTFAGSAVDTDPYPNGCPTSAQYPVCFNDQQLASEVDSFLFANNIARPANRVFFVFTPSGVDSCFDSSGFFCASNVFCGYHEGFVGGHGDALYANLPWAARPGCDSSHPNGSPADPTIDVMSHEMKEAIDDPFGFATRSLGPPRAWFDPYSRAPESSDKCVGDYGPLQNNGVGDYNQVINGHDYLLQMEWSNKLAQPQGFGCVQAGSDQAPPTAAFSASPQGAVVRLDASASTEPDPGDSISSYEWNFGDGTAAAVTGTTTGHTYPAAGTYHVTLYVTDNHGAVGSVEHDVTITAPNPSIPFTATFDETNYAFYLTGNGTATRLGSATESSPFGLIAEFSNFPASITVEGLVLLSDTSLKNSFLVDYEVTLTDTANPPQGNNYNVSGRFSIFPHSVTIGGSQPGIGADAFGSGTITGTCTSSFTLPYAKCADTWNGTIGPP